MKRSVIPRSADAKGKGKKSRVRPLAKPKRKITPPPLTYAVISVPDGEIHGRGFSRDQADEIAFIWNQDLEHHKRAAVLPDADLRHLRVTVGDLALVNDEAFGDRFKHQWPTYAVGIFGREGELLRIERLEDQRIDWCRSFNSKYEKLDMRAVPLFAFAGEDDEEGGAA